MNRGSSLASPGREFSPELAEVEVEVVRDVTGELVTAVDWLLRLTSSSARVVGADVLRTVLACPSNRLLVARLHGEIVGMLTVVVSPLATGVRAWTEDVMVDDAVRSFEVEATLIRAAVRLARSAGAETVDVTSGLARTAADQRYERLGFTAQHAKTYRLAL
ncbi:GNAT family N-acetyltransferase [Actinoplanes sp. CA-252034]|uniref:GNAT family N-acetyltransferase n=1 Tax=Actinoplanes sp. CA-252034 TaxID=3239906 RepID=UPI003D978A84